MTSPHPTFDPVPALDEPTLDNLVEHVGCALTSLRIFKRRQQPETIDAAIADLEIAATIAADLTAGERETGREG